MNTKVITYSPFRLTVMLVAGMAIVLATTFSAFAAKPSNGPTIVDIASEVNANTGEFSTLISAVAELDLVDVLSGNRQYTVFAPTDEAFAGIGLDANSFVGLSDEAKAAYTDIVLYHVTNGVRYSQSVVGNKMLRMANGDFAKVSGATIDGASIVGLDIRASNGIIHVVDTVLLPPES